jgi:hypothetical protein
MKNKKFLSLILALAMIFSMSVSVFAGADPDLGNTQFTATATVKVPSINVKVPSTAGAIFINPMGFALKIDSGAAATAAEKANDTDGTAISSEKVISPIYTIKNESPMKLDVLVNAVATIATEGADVPKALAVASAPIATDSTKNEVFIYAQFDAPTTAVDSSYEATMTKVAYNATTPASNHLVVPAKAVKENTKVGTMVEAGDDTFGVMNFQFFGDCNPNAKLEWETGDKLTVSMTFTFKPAVTPATPAAGG